MCPDRCRSSLVTRARAVTFASVVLSVALAGCSTPTEPAQEFAPEVEPVAWRVKVPLGLSEDLQAPSDNPVTRGKVELGRRLYYDPMLSVAGDISCASCHHPARGFTDGRPTSTGHKGQMGTRSAPTVINATYNYSQFWDGRAATLEEQALGPIQNPIEMGNTLDGMVANLQAIPEYPPLFEVAFGDPEITPDRVGRAIASFERIVLSGNSEWDRFMGREEGAMNEQKQRGWELFKGKAKCTLCHAGQTFSDSDFHNLGVGMSSEKPDLGRYLVTKDERDKGAFKTPTVRDLSKTAPYMHDGSMKTLEEVLEFYNKGGETNPWLDDKVTPLNLTQQEIEDIIAFLHALEGEMPNDVGPPTPEREENSQMVGAGL